MEPHHPRARTSLLVGLATTALGVVVSTLIGGTSGFLGGKLDLGVQRFVDAWMSFPALLLLLTVTSIVGRGVPQIILVLGIAGGIGGSRVLRGAVIDIKENVYFESADAIGSSKWRAFFRHVVPNIMPVIIIGFSINIGGVILSIASLGFLGYGLPFTIPEWGGLLQPGRARVHGDSAAAGSLARSRPDHYRLLSQHVRRRRARPARPQAQGRCRWSRRRSRRVGSIDGCANASAPDVRRTPIATETGPPLKAFGPSPPERICGGGSSRLRSGHEDRAVQGLFRAGAAAGQGRQVLAVHQADHR